MPQLTEKKPLTREEKLEAGWLSKYGALFPPLPQFLCRFKGQPEKNIPAWDAYIRANTPGPEMAENWRLYYIERCMLATEGQEGYMAVKPKGYMGWQFHFREMVSILFGRPECFRKFQWNPNAVRILEYYEKYAFLGLAGHASSGKSDCGMMIGLMEWLLDPFNTKILVTTTTLKDGDQRIWGSCQAYWSELRKFFGGEKNLPGRLVASQGIIRAVINGKASSLAGISIIAGEKSQESESTSKIIGFKAKRMRLIADELSELAEGLFTAAKGNLFSNPDFKMIGISNPSSYYDPFGTFTEPKDGYKSINEHSDGWETKTGYCLRFDGHKSPNVLSLRDNWLGLITMKQLAEWKIQLGEESPTYWRMVRGFYSPSGLKNSIYSEQEIIAHGADKPVLKMGMIHGKLAFLDPSFTKGGDRAVAYSGQMVNEQLEDGDFQMVLEVLEGEDLMKKVNAKHPTKDASEQLAELYGQWCDHRNVPIPHRGLDSTGGGIPFASLLAIKMGQGFVHVSFSGEASDKQISKTDLRTGKERFVNKVSELWWVGKEYVRSNQIRGLDATVIKELCARTYDQKGEKIQVESKKDMKASVGYSPDWADAFAGLLEVARQKFSFFTTEKAVQTPKKSKEPEPYADLRPKTNGGKRHFIVAKWSPKFLGWDNPH